LNLIEWVVGRLAIVQLEGTVDRIFNFFTSNSLIFSIFG